MACRTYCKEGDPTIQKMYDEWKVSERGKQANYSTQDRALESDDVLFEAVNACQSKCMGDLMTGKATADTKCQ
jgi:hypothetical protein